jgi:hypothetical protein
VWKTAATDAPNDRTDAVVELLQAIATFPDAVAELSRFPLGFLQAIAELTDAIKNLPEAVAGFPEAVEDPTPPHHERSDAPRNESSTPADFRPDVHKVCQSRSKLTNAVHYHVSPLRELLPSDDDHSPAPEKLPDAVTESAAAVPTFAGAAQDHAQGVEKVSDDATEFPSSVFNLPSSVYSLPSTVSRLLS